MHRTSKQSQAQSQAQPSEITTSFSLQQAIVWQIKFILNSLKNKKEIPIVTNELVNLSYQFGMDFDKYLLKELIEQIDLKDPTKASRDKTEPLKVQLLNQELARSCQKPEFLQYFSEIAQAIFNDRVTDFLNELTKRLRLNLPTQILVALSLTNCIKEDTYLEALKLLKQRLIDYHNFGKPEPLPDYAVHKLIWLLNGQEELKSDETLKDINQYIIDSNQPQPTSHVALRCPLQQDWIYANAINEEPSVQFIKEGTGLDSLDKTSKMLEPWQILLDLGHMSSYNYNYLLLALSEFKDINEKKMAKTLLHISIQNVGQDDQVQRIVYNTFEANKKADSQFINKEPSDKKNQISWSVDNLARAFRELYSNLNWYKVFEALSEIEESLYIDAKAFTLFLQIFNKSKPQNLQFPLQVILDLDWKSPLLQISFLENSMQFYLEKKEKSIQFFKTNRRQENVEELAALKEKVSQEMLTLWQSVDLVERLIILSDSHYFHKVRSIFETPLKQLPEYLLLTISLTKPYKGNLMIDELLSLLLPQFLGNHLHSIPVLQQLWKNNQALMIRGICELCRHDQRVMNLSRVLDITQEVKESLIPIVHCADYFFAVNLGILAGKRDFLHYDVWLQSRIKDVGTPFIQALLKYIKDHIITPINEYKKRHTNLQTNQLEIGEEQLETFKQQVLERSHLSKEKLCLTLEHLQNPSNDQNLLIRPETKDQIRDVVIKAYDLFPSQNVPTQNSEEIDNAANEYFQTVFSAEPELVDQKITELIETMKKFKQSEIKKEQEVYACMLHSLFDEYRFLHRYPQPYLEKIAKLFGAIIKNRIIDGTLLDIALKFAFEAFRREGKRQKFGIITTRQLFDMLPQFPKFFADIYEIRSNLENSDPQMLQDLEKLWDKTMKNREEKQEQKKEDTQQQRPQQQRVGEEVKVQPQDVIDQQKISQDRVKQTLTSQQVKAQEQKIAQQIQQQQQFQAPPSQIHKINESDFLNTFQQRVVPQVQQVPQQQQQQILLQQPQIQQQQIKSPNIPANIMTQMVPNLQNLQRTSTPLQNQAPPFIPSKKVGQYMAQGSQVFQPTTFETSNLNVQSEVFRKVPSSTTPLQQIPIPTLNTNVQTFKPSTFKLGPASQLTQSQQTFITQMEQKLSQNKFRMEDILEDITLQCPSQKVQEDIKFICNNTGKNNFSAKLEDLKACISQNIQVNLSWLINYILIKRIQSPSLHPIYIDMIRQLGIKDSITQTVVQAIEIFKKCMLIDEEAMFRVLSTQASQVNPIKNYLFQLGQFLGGLTVANNKPILSKELDMKQLLVEGFQSEKLKYVVAFVCRIIKECQKSIIFKASNPWVNSILQLLREIYDNHIQFASTQNSSNEITMEIEGTFKTLGLQSIKDIPNTGVIKAIQTQQYSSQHQQIEVVYLLSKNALIPQPAPPPQKQQPIKQADVQNIDIPLTSQNSPKVKISRDILQILKQYLRLEEQQIRQLVGSQVDLSIIDILSPVVDRSVTIALITTRELVLKDFSFDGDANKILRAADLIVQNLAGSLALVTCREPLKISLTTNLKKAISNINNQIKTQMEQGLTEIQINDITSMLGKENLELGCLLIKEAVIDKALKKVREDSQICKAIEKRRKFQEQGGQLFKDEVIVNQFPELPPQLQPNPNGLTEAQFQVYEDFDKLSLISQKPNQESEAHIAQQEQLEDIEKILKYIEIQTVLNDQTKNILVNKLKQMNQTNNNTENQKLWEYAEKWLFTIVKKFDEQNVLQITPFIELLSIIVTVYKAEDFSKKLTLAFLQMDHKLQNVDLNILLMKNGIISITEWDKQMSMFLNDQASQLSEEFYQFIAEFLDSSINTYKIITYNQVPNMMKVIEKVIKDNPNNAKFFDKITFGYSQGALRQYFFEWIQLSMQGGGPNYEEEINKFFNNLIKQDIFKNPELMLNFCKVMVETSIQKAIFTNSGEMRPIDRFDYRYIESFVKLIVVLLNTNDFNKHEFMTKVFEAIQEVLDQDHRNTKGVFNQKPYYRMLMNILRAINHSQCFNQKTHQLILFGLVELFNKLNPNKYPAFAFAWLELISHKQFMPYFLKITYSGQQQQQNQNLNQDNTLKWFKYKELIVHLFTFLKNNMIPGLKTTVSMMKFYEATLRIVLVILHDFPEFLSDFHFNFVNSLPEHCIQLKNMILSSYPKGMQPPNPFQKQLKVDQLEEIRLKPRILSNYDNYLTLLNLREDLDSFFRTKNPKLIGVICDKMMQSEEVINGRRKINSSVINAVVLYIANYESNFIQKEQLELFKQIVQRINNETKWVFLNSIVNELRFPNSNTYYFSYVIIYLFVECQNPIVQEFIAKILFERLQVNKPHPWGVNVSFRELIQNPKYGFMKKSFITLNQQAVDNLFETKLREFQAYVQPLQNQQQQYMQFGQTAPHEQ